MTDDLAPSIAHVLRRTTFGPFPGSVETAIEQHGDAAGLLEATLAAEPLAFDPPGNIDQNFDDVPESLGSDQLVHWWIDRMCSDEAGLHDRMMWFWHTHFTTSADKSQGLLCWRQLRTIHEHALGNFGDLTRVMTLDGAMLQYLDGDGSAADEPNENYGRELMELFTLGRGNYQQQDVVAAAKALAGWNVNWETSMVEPVPANRMRWPVTFLGTIGMFTAEGIVDQILEQPAVAPFIVGKLWDSFIGGERNNELVANWADEFRSSNYEIAPLLASMLRSEQFANAALNRPRSAIEWFCPVIRATEHREFGSWDLASLGQLPFHPPNVAGWPDPSRWLSATSFLARGTYVTWFDVANADTIGREPDVVEAALRHCGLYDVSPDTRGALRGLARSLDVDDYTNRGTTMIRSVLLSPEFALA